MKNDSDTHIKSAVKWLLSKQCDGGYWNAELETNCCMEAQWLMASKFCGIKSGQEESIIKYIINSQREDGSWDVYRNAENGDVNTTLECYFALRISGFNKNLSFMKSARLWLLENNWINNIRVFTKYWLALFGEWDWKKTPALMPEIICFPKWFPFNIYNFSSWARATIMPLAVVASMRPVKRLPDELRADELFPNGRIYPKIETSTPSKFSLSDIFLLTDKIIHFYNEKMADTSFRRKSMNSAMNWILKHQDDDGFWGGIQPPWIYAIIAMHILGFSPKQKNMAAAINALNLHWTEKTEKGTRVKATESPVWDTMLALNSLLDAGVGADDERILKAVDYLLENENKTYGDWSEKLGRNVEPTGWSFQRANKFYPDIDDTAVAMIALEKFRKLLPEDDARGKRVDGAIKRSISWLEAMQSRNGGWGAFDKNNDKSLITKIPFCDFGEVLDPPSVDVTAHVVEALVACGVPKDNAGIKAAVKFILSEQESDGSWFGRWGINYIYGTWCALSALKAVGFDSSSPVLKKALDWLAGIQNKDGGWGESASTYMTPGSASKSTASQTAWALIGLMSFDSGYSKEIGMGLKFLRDTQTKDGTWLEEEYTGTGFPGYGLGAKLDIKNGKPLPQGKELSRGFMLRYGNYCHYFPMAALAKGAISA